jgi:hypothetical protein
MFISESIVKFSNSALIYKFGGASMPVEMVLRPSSLLLRRDDFDAF